MDYRYTVVIIEHQISRELPTVALFTFRIQ